MKGIANLAFSIGLLFGIFGCSPQSPVPPESNPGLQSTLTETSHPLTTRTGIDEIDRVLDASGDVHKLRSLVEYTSARCTTMDGLGGPPKCLQGEGEGTLVEVLPFLGPEGYFLRKDEIRDWSGFESSGIFAIYEVSASAFSDENYPSGRYAILFVTGIEQPAVSLRISDGGIVRVDYIFDSSPEALNDLVQRESARLVLAPLKT